MIVQTVGYLYGISVAGAAPTAPTFSVVAGTDSFTLTIDGDAGVTNYVLYAKTSDSAWSDGGSRAGDGDVVISPLDPGVAYILCVYSSDAGTLSIPALAVCDTLELAAGSLFKAGLVDYIKNAALIIAISGTKLFPQKLPQGTVLPAIVYDIVTGDPKHSFDGPIGFRRTSVDLTCWADTDLEAGQLADAVRLSLDGYTGEWSGNAVESVLDNTNDTVDDLAIGGKSQTKTNYGVVMDFTFWHRTVRPDL